MRCRTVADEEDVALDALDSFCRRAQEGQFPNVTDRNDLWRLLVIITARKVCHLLRDKQRLKRGGADVTTQAVPLDTLLGREPTPDFLVEIAEQYQLLLDALGEDDLRLGRRSEDGRLHHSRDCCPPGLCTAHRRTPTALDPRHLGKGGRA